MTSPLQHASHAQRVDHLFKVISSERFRKKQGLGNEVPFFICPYKAHEAVEMERAVKQLINRLSQTGVRVLSLNLYDLCIETMKAEGDWEWFISNEASQTPAKKLENLESMLDVESVVVPAIVEQMDAHEFDVMFLSGVGEVFPYIRSHNVLNNLQKVAKAQPTLMFFPGEYSHSLEKGASLDLFGRLRDDKYYRAFNIFDQQI
ncbi:MAG: DUF1788 domain-containing protein [Pirellulaceae bacterium]|jgi:hypothetical protein|nr:DUF1788 domain-containing protein [Pirellulaceae bacterium]